MTYHLWADSNGDARMSREPPTCDKNGKIMNMEELGKLLRDRLVRIRNSGKLEIEQVSSELPFVNP